MKNRGPGERGGLDLMQGPGSVAGKFPFGDEEPWKGFKKEETWSDLFFK